jgi:type II secretory ATPase GspE/PulE/Tfp pilus assembly ATPase PilB-like protein
MEIPSTETQLLTKAWNLFSQENYAGAHELCLAGYEKGFRSYDLVRLLLDSLNKMGRMSEQGELTLKILSENNYSAPIAAKLYFRAGLICQHQQRYDEARELFEKVLALDPAFPGIEQRIKALAPKPAVASSRYSYLLERGLVTQEALSRALEAKDPDAVLLGELRVSKEDLGESLARFYKTEFVPFSSQKEAPFELFEKRRLDPDFLKRFGWLPFEYDGSRIVVLMLNPYDLGRIDEIRFIYGTSNIVPKVTLAQDLEHYIEHFYRQLSGGEDLASAFDEDVATGDVVAGDDTVEADLSEQDSEVVRMVNALLLEAWRKNVSDIHIEPNPFGRYCLIRFRIDGTCHEFRKIRLALARPIVSRLKIMAHLDIAERRLPQDGKIKIKLPDRNQVVEYRMATIPTIENQEDVVLRVLASGKPLPLDKLGLLPNNKRAFEAMIHKPYGLILVVGPTGSGKTTTLHSAVSYINTSERKIWTAEDPVEITQEGLRQVQVQPKIGLTFAAVLRSFLRADPDVIMIGEMRDKETAHIGVEASLTGHLVFSTLHTNSAPETVTRLLDMDLDPFNFADSLLCVLAQRLVKTLCPNCKEAYGASDQEIEELRMEFGPGFDTHAQEFLQSERTLYRKVGCNQCMGSGYKGRVGIHELMLSSEGIKTSIKYRKPTEEIRAQAVADGMLSLKQDGILKVLQGRTDVEQVRAVAG